MQSTRLQVRKLLINTINKLQLVQQPIDEQDDCQNISIQGRNLITLLEYLDILQSTLTQAEQNKFKDSDQEIPFETIYKGVLNAQFNYKIVQDKSGQIDFGRIPQALEYLDTDRNGYIQTDKLREILIAMQVQYERANQTEGKSQEQQQNSRDQMELILQKLKRLNEQVEIHEILSIFSSVQKQ